MTWERVETFAKDFFWALGHCVAEDVEVLDIAILAVVCLGAFWLLAVVVHEIMFDPHVTTAAALDSFCRSIRINGSAVIFRISIRAWLVGSWMIQDIRKTVCPVIITSAAEALKHMSAYGSAEALRHPRAWNLAPDADRLHCTTVHLRR